MPSKKDNFGFYIQTILHSLILQFKFISSTCHDLIKSFSMNIQQEMHAPQMSYQKFVKHPQPRPWAHMREHLALLACSTWSNPLFPLPEPQPQYFHTAFLQVDSHPSFRPQSPSLGSTIYTSGLTAKTLLFHLTQFFWDDGTEIGDKDLMDSSLWPDHYLHPMTQRYLEVLEN